MFENICWDILDTYFQKGGSPESSNPLVKHQIDSYNKFIDNTLTQIISGFNPIKIKIANPKNDMPDNTYNIYINILQPSLTKPYYQLQDGTQTIMTPYIARMNNLTYSSSLYVNVHVVTEITNKDGVIEKFDKTVNGVYIGKIPIMVRSKLCVLSQMQGVGEENNNECIYDFGGYFIVNGNEKVLISQDRINENKTLVFQPNNNAEGLYAEIRSMCDSSYLPPKTTSLNMSGKLNHMGRIIRMNTSFLRTEIPVFVVFRALGITSDKEIIEHIVYDMDNTNNQRIINELMACCEDACDVNTQEQAENALIKIMIGSNKNTDNKALLQHNLTNDFLPHVGTSYRRKALYLGYIIRKMIRIYLGYDTYDNRDSYINKRVDTPGVLMSNLFRQCYGKMTKELKVVIEKELNLWRGNASVPNSEIITDINIHRFFKQSLLESWIKYSLSTGNWGIKSIGSFQNIRQGVSQVLNRMSYASTLSHMRRINTAMEKNGKLVQPRKLDNSQIGMICPAECFDPDTPILLWNGTIKKARDIIIGDYLIDDKGNAVKVKSTCSGYKTMYEVLQHKKDFMNYTVTDNHILTLKVKQHKNSRNKRGKLEFSWFDKKELRYKYKTFDNINELNEFASSINDDNVIDITIEQYLSLPENVQRQLYTFKSDGINWETKEVALDPYILGMWLGDGLSSGIADKALLDKWFEWGKDKHIPLNYLTNDRKTRLAVLAGLIDTDGIVRADGHEIRISQCEPNYKIIYDTEFLARSLGFSCHLNDSMRSYTANGEKRLKHYKELIITGKYLYEIPTVLHHKKLNKCNNQVHEKRCISSLQSSFKLIKKDIQAFVGWQLEGNGRFLLGDMSVSHNTPEGSSVGLVKNMALSTNISIAMNSTHVRRILVELGVVVYDDTYSRDTSVSFLKNMGNAENVYIMVNGDIIGYYDKPNELYMKLKHFKRSGIIHPMTSVIWNIQKSYIAVSTEAGRMYRPLYIVDIDPVTQKRELRINRILRRKNISWQEYIKDKHFDYFIVPNEPSTEQDADSYMDEEGFLEYMDCDEINHAMIATFPSDLEKGMKGTAYPPFYTHCEIHPSLMNGILGVNIPFSDHNQSPRNCYQCINERETVYMSDGSFKMIKDVVVGDKVVCFDPVTMQSEHTVVVNHYNRYTPKIVYNVLTVSGRHLIATYDHKFMTSDSWAVSGDFRKLETKLGIYMKSNLHGIKNRDVALQENIVDFGKMSSNIYKDMQLLPLHNNHKFINIIARIAGSYYVCEAKFTCDKDAMDFNKDVKLIGFEVYGMYDTNFIIYIKQLVKNISWIMKCSNIAQVEFAGAYMSAKFANLHDLSSWQARDIDETVYNILQEIGVAKLESYADYHQYYSNIGCRYNTALMTDLAIANEYYLYTEYKDRMGLMTIDYTAESWKNTVVVKGDILFVPFHERYQNSNKRISDITVASNSHSFIGGNSFAISNCAMGKQALGVYMSNFNKRIDTMGNILNYPQKSLVYTKLSKYTMAHKLPSGVNAIVAIMTHTGFNQEDSIMVNQSALDRGLFTSTYYKAMRDVCNKNHSTGEEELFANPTNMTSLKPYSYNKLNDDGFISKNTYVNGNDILVGKVMPKKSNGVIAYQDNSLTMKTNDDGYVDMNYSGVNSDGYKFCKIRIRKNRKPEIGDKCASCSAQKGTIGMIYRHQDMPFTKDGVVPDIIMNPHAIPSRMTMAQLMECIMGKAGCHIGAFGDATPYNDCSVESIAKVLEMSGMERYGNEILYNGRTGEQIRTEIFIGPTYYQRLKHMTQDKLHSRGSNGPIVMLTRQPSEGRARSGGLRLGEMERDCFLSHGTANFLAERMLHVSDNYRVFVCKKCGMHANVNTDKDIYNCKYCKNNTDIAQVRMPYAFKLLNQELYTMNIMMRYVCN